MPPLVVERPEPPSTPVPMDPPIGAGSSDAPRNLRPGGPRTQPPSARILASAGEDGFVKYSQPIDCSIDNCWFSNYNSTNDFLRLDDFICNATGYITHVNFWGAAWDGAQAPLDNLDFFRIRIYEWVDGGPCGWSKGKLLCTNDVPLGQVGREYTCTIPFGIDMEKFSVLLPNACYQTLGTHYAIEGTCLHAGGPLHEGSVQGTTLTCPWHEWQFDLTDGSCGLHPGALKCFPTRVVDGVVEVLA